MPGGSNGTILAASFWGCAPNEVSGGPDISGDGRLVVFFSQADNLVANDTNDSADIFLHDRQSGTTQRISVDENGDQLAGDSVWDVYLYDKTTEEVKLLSESADGSTSADAFTGEPVISVDGRFVVFSSVATNLVAPALVGNISQVYIYDGEQLDDSPRSHDIADDGRFIAFSSSASNLVTGGVVGVPEIYSILNPLFP